MGIANWSGAACKAKKQSFDDNTFRNIFSLFQCVQTMLAILFCEKFMFKDRNFETIFCFKNACLLRREHILTKTPNF